MKYSILLCIALSMYLTSMGILLIIFSRTTIYQQLHNIHASFLVNAGHGIHKGLVDQATKNLRGEHTLTRLNSPLTSQDDPRLVEIIQRQFLHLPSTLPYNLSHPDVIDHSGGHQAAIVDYLLGNKTDGFFVECGALDGESRSNTLYLERFRNWTGLLIEADYLNFNKVISKRRKAHITNTCLSVHQYPSVEKFNPNFNMGKIYKDSFMYKLWTLRNGLSIHPIDVQCFPLYSFMLALKTSHIDYLSLDVEGLELEILKTIPFHLLDITLITAEFSHTHGGKHALRRFMESTGYMTLGELTKHTSDYLFAKASYVNNLKNITDFTDKFKDYLN